MNKGSFVLYESVYKQFELLKKRKPESAGDFIEAIMEFGLYGVIPDEESDVWLYGFEQSITSISAAKDRYNTAIENGKKGGRPKEVDETKKKKSELFLKLGSMVGVAARSVSKTASSVLKEVQTDWEKIRKQQLYYGIMKLYENDLESFIQG